MEVVSPCPTNWGMQPMDAMKWLRENMFEYYQLGVFRDITAEGESGN